MIESAVKKLNVFVILSCKIFIITHFNETKRPTLQDIAAHLGMTKMTVSRYLRNPNSVAKDTQQRIAAAIEQFGYILIAHQKFCLMQRVKQLVCYSPL